VYCDSVLYVLVLMFLPRCMKCRRGLAMRILSVCPSVRLSVRRVICDKMEERSVQIFIPYERTFSLVYWEDRMVGGGATPSTTDPHLSKIADFQPIIARSASAVTPSEKVQLMLIGSRIWAFDWYQTRWPTDLEWPRTA